MVRAPRPASFQRDVDPSPQAGTSVSKLLRGLAAGYGAREMGGGRLTTILVFPLLWWLLGSFDLFR